LRKRLLIAGLCIYLHPHDPLSFKDRVTDLLHLFPNPAPEARTFVWNYLLPPTSVTLQLSMRRKASAMTDQAAENNVRPP
jgi:hypothetical protein